jgi:hypothetical protein
LLKGGFVTSCGQNNTLPSTDPDILAGLRTAREMFDTGDFEDWADWASVLMPTVADARRERLEGLERQAEERRQAEEEAQRLEEAERLREEDERRREEATRRREERIRAFEEELEQLGVALASGEVSLVDYETKFSEVDGRMQAVRDGDGESEVDGGEEEAAGETDHEIFGTEDDPIEEFPLTQATATTMATNVDQDARTVDATPSSPTKTTARPTPRKRTVPVVELKTYGKRKRTSTEETAPVTPTVPDVKQRGGGEVRKPGVRFSEYDPVFFALLMFSSAYFAKPATRSPSSVSCPLVTRCASIARIRNGVARSTRNVVNARRNRSIRPQALPKFEASGFVIREGSLRVLSLFG